MVYRFRFFVEESSLEAAEKTLTEICERVQKFGISHKKSCVDYWKIPENKEITFTLNTHDAVPLSDLAKVFGNDWDIQKEHEWIWGHIPEGKFLFSSVRWAHIERLEE